MLFLLYTDILYYLHYFLHYILQIFFFNVYSCNLIGGKEAGYFAASVWELPPAPVAAFGRLCGAVRSGGAESSSAHPLPRPLPLPLPHISCG